jgi:8-oxo-dGTP pyrophosphatase MutT (NUDIX family)
VREVAEEAGGTIEVTGLAGVYSDPGHILAYPGGERVYQQFAVCFHALTTVHNAEPDQDETIAATWFDSEQATQLVMHPAMHRRLTDALTEPSRAHFDQTPLPRGHGGGNSTATSAIMSSLHRVSSCSTYWVPR